MQDQLSDETLSQQISVREKSISELRKLLLDREQATAALRLSLDDHEDTIQALRQQIREQEIALKAIREANQRRQQELDDLQARLAEREDDDAYRVILALTLANVAYDALMVLDDTYHIIAINDAAETLFGITRPIGQHIVEVTHKPELEFMLDDALQNEEDSLEEQMSFGKRIYRVKVRVLRTDDYFFIGVAMQEVTDLVRLNRARRDMVANISHELRTPIANIRLTIDSLFHEQDRPKRKQSTTALKAIARETDSLLWLVQELLDLSMIESGQAILRMVETSLSQLVDDTIERMEEQAEAKSITIASSVTPDVIVLADADQVRRVLVNLIHNGLKWSPAGGQISISAEQTGDEFTVTVQDQGPGVPDELTERIFERFYQADASRSGGEGTGLGLAICKHIIEAHGGRIWAEGNSTAGGGCFRFTLPTS